MTRDDGSEEAMVGYFVSPNNGLDTIERGEPIFPSYLRPSGFKQIPVVISTMPAVGAPYAGGSGLIVNDGYRMGREISLVHLHAEAWYDSATDLVYMKEGLQSMEIEAHKKNIDPIVLETNADGTREPLMEPHEDGPGGRVRAAPGDDIRAVQLTGPQFAKSEPLRAIDKELNDIYPEVLIATDFPSGTSGFFQVNAIDQALNFFVPIVAAMESALKGSLDEVFHQMRVSPKLSLTVSGLDPMAPQQSGMHSRFTETFTGVDIPEDITEMFDITLPPEIPNNFLQQLEMAIQATQSGLLSAQTALVQILGVEDPGAEMERIKKERAEAHPFLQVLELAALFQDKVIAARDAYKSAVNHRAKPEVIQERRIYLNALQAQVRQIQQMLMGGAGGQPQQQGGGEGGGFSPEVLPPEAGVNNPDRRAVAEGRPNAATGGRPRAEGTP